MEIECKPPLDLTYEQANEVFHYMLNHFRMLAVEGELEFMELPEYEVMSDEEKLETVKQIAEKYGEYHDESGDWLKHCHYAIESWQEDLELESE